MLAAKAGSPCLTTKGPKGVIRGRPGSCELRNFTVSFDVMCGRFTLHSRDRIKLKGLVLDLPFEPRYNIAPSQEIVAIADFGHGIEARSLVWGLIPSWSSDGKAFINAR